MKSYSINQLREMYLSFFQSKQHKRLPSASLVPHQDPTVLLTNAGMVQFKPYFLGYEKPPYTRVTTCQRCLRTQDIDNVGRTDRHGTFFEMLGNFSFGDYFKEEVIGWAWEFVTEHLQLPPEKLWVSIFHDDDEAFEIWQRKAGIPADRIVRLGREDNFWEIGVGPCGPCSEIHVDRGPEFGCGKPDCKPGCDCDRYMEFWNLVFIQFFQNEAGEYIPLETKGIDTGMGLERVAAFLQGAASIFDTDIMRPIVTRAAELAGTRYGNDDEADVSLRVISDHARAITFLVNDGVLPSNEGRGYVLRRLLRRAARHGKLLGIEGEFLNKVIEVVIEQMKAGYPEIVEKREYIFKVVGFEERRFNETIDQGISMLQNLITKSRKENIISGEDVFRLYDTFGFPLELTREIASEHGFQVDEQGFRREMENQRERARAARTDFGYLANSSAERFQDLQGKLAVEFTGYQALQQQSKIVALYRDGSSVVEAGEGDQVSVVLAETPFYAESGGQVADQGEIISDTGRIAVRDVKKPLEGIIVHSGVVESGHVAVGDVVAAQVTCAERAHTARHHTATHLLHKALRDLLGDHVNQAGSHVSPERLRFDFTHFEQLTRSQLEQVEDTVNQIVLSDLEVQADVMSMEEAKRLGAVALFGEKYGDEVRVVQVGDYSKELCGGTHVSRTGEIGLVKIISEGSAAAGVRRIEAVCGMKALEYLRSQTGVIEELCAKTNSTSSELIEQIDRLLTNQRMLERENRQLKQKLGSSLVDDLVAAGETIGNVTVVTAEVPLDDPQALRELGDKIKSRLNSGAIVLAARSEGKVLLVSMVTPDLAGKLLHAGDLVKQAAKICGGGGGGRPDMAQAGGRQPEKIAEALETVKAGIRDSLKEMS